MSNPADKQNTDQHWWYIKKWVYKTSVYTLVNGDTQWLTLRKPQKLESSKSPHTSAKAMLFARWQHHLRFCSGFPYAPLKAMVTKISKWSRIQDSFRITPKIELLVACAISDIPSKFQNDSSITFWVILLSPHRHANCSFFSLSRHFKAAKNSDIRFHVVAYPVKQYGVCCVIYAAIFSL